MHKKGVGFRPIRWHVAEVHQKPASPKYKQKERTQWFLHEASIEGSGCLFNERQLDWTILQKFYCLRQGTSKRGEGQPFLSCRGWKTA